MPAPYLFDLPASVSDLRLSARRGGGKRGGGQLTAPTAR